MPSAFQHTSHESEICIKPYILSQFLPTCVTGTSPCPTSRIRHQVGRGLSSSFHCRFTWPLTSETCVALSSVPCRTYSALHVHPLQSQWMRVYSHFSVSTWSRLIPHPTDKPRVLCLQDVHLSICADHVEESETVSNRSKQLCALCLKNGWKQTGHSAKTESSSRFNVQINPLKPSGYYMYHPL
jgi:hypothetical protein